MAHEEEKLPWELTEEILSRVPPQSLVRFRTVSKQWNTLFNDKTFMNNHKTTFRFILSTESKIYSVSINPKIEVRELHIPGLESKIIPSQLVDFNGFMFCGMGKETLIWNPWLNQTRRSKLDLDQLQVSGIVYDDNTRSYKTLVYRTESNSTKTLWKIGDFESNVWESEYHNQAGGENSKKLAYKSVSLDGHLYWITSYTNVSMFRVIFVYDFSTGRFQKYCDLPCGDDNHHDDDVLVLGVYKGDRFSLLKQCHLTDKIEIWVSKNKIRGGDHVEWMKIMEVSIPNLPHLQIESHYPPSYFIDDDKRQLVVCSCDEYGRIWIDVFGENKMISETQLDLVFDSCPFRCTFFPSLVSVSPQGQREEKELSFLRKLIKTIFDF